MSRLTQSELKTIAHDCGSKISAARNGTEYFSEPFRHLVVDDFFPIHLAQLCADFFPSSDQPGWDVKDVKDIEIKYRTDWKSEFDVPEHIVDAVRILNSSIILKSLGERIGIPKLIPDPYFTGGGLNVCKRGGLLDVHVDGNYHDATGLNRRINLIVYLTRRWEPGWGGEFGLYDQDGRHCVKKVAPLFNRCLIFDSHDYSFHGLPDPLCYPDNEERRSIILYYYTKDPRPAHHIATAEPHSALWVKKDLLDHRGNKTRDFT